MECLMETINCHVRHGASARILACSLAASVLMLAGSFEMDTLQC